MSLSQHERLAAFAELDERETRKTLGCTPDLIAEAVAGNSLDPLIVARLVEFLEQQAHRPCELNRP